MNKRPETILRGATDDIVRQIPADIPVTSPYYDRLRALNDQICFVPVNSPEYRFITKTIAELERRAMKRKEDEARFGITF